MSNEMMEMIKMEMAVTPIVSKSKGGTEDMTQEDQFERLNEEMALGQEQRNEMMGKLMMDKDEIVTEMEL